MDADAEEAPAAAGRARRAASLNVLFEILGLMEANYPSHRAVVLRNPSGAAAGLIQSHEGLVGSASTPWERDSLADALQSVLPLPPQAARELAARSIRPGVSPFAAFAAQGDFPAEAVRKVALVATARECLRIAESCGGEAPKVLTLSVGAPAPFPFRPLEIFMQSASALDQAPSDFASEAYAEFSPEADAALLLLRPADEKQLPVPIAAKGFDQASLATVVPLCFGAVQMCRPEVFLRAGEKPVVSTRLTEGATWVAAAGERRMVLLRIHSRLTAARLLSQAVASMRKGPA